MRIVAVGLGGDPGGEWGLHGLCALGGDMVSKIDCHVSPVQLLHLPTTDVVRITCCLLRELIRRGPDGYYVKREDVERLVQIENTLFDRRGPGCGEYTIGRIVPHVERVDL